MKNSTEKPDKASIYFDASGKIQAIVLTEVNSYGPMTGLAMPEGCQCWEMDWPEELAELSLLDVHHQYQVDAQKGDFRLVRVKE